MNSGVTTTGRLDCTTSGTSKTWTDEELLAEARFAAQRSYSPYSHFPVGAALLLDDGRLVHGCNFENASYGLTICAERNGIGGAIVGGEPHSGDGVPFRIQAVAIVGKAGEPCWPCGACRQALREFNCQRVIVEDGDNSLSVDFAAILPYSFGPESL
ncbi:Cytidine deaminase [Corynebacterium pseudotuberculosis]|uniref:cytidine deaminase n=1 Tax=Corynebacterium pseudotuberculosis TaxID=1719 RepID=UPI00065E14CE|nr:cytidine deaminase [Corynebacterium pseudotuberculosis]AKP09583.2 Cytidine deaminase [Corynebacterium pseudotuberculosis]